MYAMGWTVNSLYSTVKRGDNLFSTVVSDRHPALSDFTLIRRQNVLALFQTYAGHALSQGIAPKGLEQDYAARLQISPSMWSQIKSARPIGNKLARQIEAACDQPNGWLDEAHEDAPPTEEEKAFMALAMNAWRASNAAGRRTLRKQMEAIAQDS